MRHRGRPWLSGLTAAVMLLAGSLTAVAVHSGTALAASGTQYTLQGCRNNQTTPPYKTGTFICNDALYTTGDLGKGWAELDYVPFRLIVQTGKTGWTVSRN